MRHVVPAALLALLCACGAIDAPSGSTPSDSDAPRAGGDGGVPPRESDPPPPPPPPIVMHCFAAGTPIATPEGERPIEALAIGDAVWGFDTARGVRVQSHVTALHASVDGSLGRLTLPSGRELYVTREHPIYLPERDAFVPVGELSGDERIVLMDDGAQPAVSDAPPSYEPDVLRATVYNLSVAGVEDYFAAGALVHNKQPPRCPGDDFSADACQPIMGGIAGSVAAPMAAPCASYDPQTGTGCDSALVDPAPACELSSAPLSREAYGERLQRLFGADQIGGATLPDPADQLARNRFLTQLFARPTAPGRALGRWLRLPIVAGTTDAIFGGPDNQLAAMLIANAATLLVRAEGASLRELLQYREGHATAVLSELLDWPIPDALRSITDAGGVVPLELPPERRGLFTEPAFLRWHPTPSDRGRVIAELLQCGSFAPHAPSLPPPSTSTTRYDAYAGITAIAPCAPCHAPIDGIGLALEQFDESGLFRPTDNGLTVTPLGALPVAGAVEGPVELAQGLLAAPELAACVARSLLSSALERELTAADACSLSWITAHAGAEVNLRAALLAVLTSPSFTHAAL